MAVGTLVVFALAVAGCNTAVDKGNIFNEITGKHPAGWVDSHPTSAKPDGAACKECHGDDLKGGISGVSCFSASVDGFSCHASGPAFHPDSWVDEKAKGTSAFHGTSYQQSLLDCAQCHDLNVKCQECHFGETGSKVPSGSSWTHGVISGHSQFSSNSSESSVCIKCHEVSSSLGNGPTCHNCHVEHQTGWDDPAVHGAAAKSSPGVDTGFAYCQTCHGDDFGGGSSGVPCSYCHIVEAPHPAKPWRGSTPSHTNTDPQNAAVCAWCHLGGGQVVVNPPSPPPAGSSPGCFNDTLCHGSDVGHPAGWASGDQHGPVAKGDLTYCQSCHGEQGGPGDNPRFNVPVGNLANGCEDCHQPKTAHPINQANDGWANHRTAGNMNTACALCHGATLTEGGSGPACTTCHVQGSPTVLTDCTSCHSTPPSGTTFPNDAGSHQVHDVLAGVTGNCDVCHNSAGTGTSFHYDMTPDVFVNPTYYAKSGSASYDSGTGTCSNVSCHGGQTTPQWGVGAIDVNADCMKCHIVETAPGTQYNSATSGKHDKHVNKEGFPCTQCHDPNKLDPGHFAHLETPDLEGPVSDTFRTELNYTPGNPPSCDPASGGLTGCHGQKDWK